MIIFSRQLPLIINHGGVPVKGLRSQQTSGYSVALPLFAAPFLRYKLDDNILAATFTYRNPHQSTVPRYAEEHVGLFYLQDP